MIYSPRAQPEVNKHISSRDLQNNLLIFNMAGLTGFYKIRSGAGAIRREY